MRSWFWSSACALSSRCSSLVLGSFLLLRPVRILHPVGYSRAEWAFEHHTSRQQYCTFCVKLRRIKMEFGVPVVFSERTKKLVAFAHCSIDEESDDDIDSEDSYVPNKDGLIVSSDEYDSDQLEDVEAELPTEEDLMV
ncbi:hypothetical protein AVEN_85546-1 [Araneus ventricosus]|uniref:Uncharacterized protein n=1 Tax=Araneus ventricosus TaxID=182803 RepID=A0A4Y2RHC9_ARAVE|nr:hypothetical protein AVEN_85546-1 [Araneus ventricosus]